MPMNYGHCKANRTFAAEQAYHVFRTKPLERPTLPASSRRWLPRMPGLPGLGKKSSGGKVPLNVVMAGLSDVPPRG